MVGLDLDPWQQFVLVNALGERPDGKWAAREVGVEVPRQNGKGGLLEARELAGLFLLDERLIIHSAHEFATAEEALERMVLLIESNDDLMRRVRTIKRSHGQEGIYLKNGQRLRYKTRTKGGGRGFTADCVILDEAMHIPEAMHGALFPTLRAIPNPQVWYTGSAVDKESMADGIVFARVRERALSGDAKGLAYFGWSPPFETPDDIPPEAFLDPDTWAQANPALGIRIDADYMMQEFESMSRRTFAVELLGVGDWPEGDGTPTQVISSEQWGACLDPGRKSPGPKALAYDVNVERSAAAIGAADDGRFVKVLDHRPGTGWLVARLKELSEQFDLPIHADEKGPGNSFIEELEDEGVKVEKVSGPEYAKACATFYDSVDQRTLSHDGSDELTAAVKGAAWRPLGDARAWSRKSSSVDISPLVSVTLALRGVDRERESAYESEELMIA